MNVVAGAGRGTLAVSRRRREDIGIPRPELFASRRYPMIIFGTRGVNFSAGSGGVLLPRLR